MPLIISCKYCQTPELVMCKTKNGWRLYSRILNPDGSFQRFGHAHKCDQYYSQNPSPKKPLVVKEISYIKGAKNGGYSEL